MLRHAFILIAILSAVVVGCSAGFRERLLLDEAPASTLVVSDERVKISVLPYSGEMESEVFSADLRVNEQMALEIAVENVVGNGRKFVFHRHNVVAVFGDGSRRYAAQPLKVYQKNRINKLGAYFFFGIAGYAMASAADDERLRLLGRASSALVLDEWNPKLTGHLFFDTEGLSDRRLMQLVIDYEEVGVDELWSASVDLGAFEIEPARLPGQGHPEKRKRDSRRGIDW